jgi:dTDP-glucose 4,6-dehydratase
VACGQRFARRDKSFNPSTPYAISRAAASWHLSLLHREFGLPVCITRTVNIYGERQQPFRIIPRTIHCALSGEKLREAAGPRASPLHVEDAARDARGPRTLSCGETYHIAHPLHFIPQVRDSVASLVHR